MEDDIAAHQEALRLLTTLSTSLKDNPIPEATDPPDYGETEVRRLAHAIDDLQARAPADNVRFDDPLVGEYYSALTSVNMLVTRDIARVSTAIVIPTDLTKEQFVRVKQLLQGFTVQSSDDRQPTSDLSLEPLWELSRRLPDEDEDPPKPVSVLLPYAEAAERMIPQLPAQIRQARNRYIEQMRSYYPKRQTFAERKTGELQIALGRLKTDSQDLDSKIAEAEKLGTQKFVSEQIVTLLLIMIAMIGGSYLALKWFDVELASKIVQERLMIELLSMAFLLVTIIVLALGGVLEPQSIGTLLGAIAGYLLGREPLKRLGQLKSQGKGERNSRSSRGDD